MAMKLVRPAMHSVFIEVPLACRLNNLSSKLLSGGKLPVPSALFVIFFSPVECAATAPGFFNPI